MRATGELELGVAVLGEDAYFGFAFQSANAAPVGSTMMLNHPAPGTSVTSFAIAALRALVASAAGVIISSPEYAHGVPGAMKNALDWLVSYPEFAGKPVVLWNASAAGGQWAQASLLEILKTMSARVLVEASLMDPFLVRKLRPGEELTDERSLHAVKSSLAALAAFESPRPPREASPGRPLRPAEGDPDRWNETSPPAFPRAEAANPRSGGAR